ncbi:MAG TPA: hypothetical protein VNM15_03085 [Candidatus Binatia bacterium]|nr:hypothetical protein [Candidatus Binatia bacterium]
MPTIWYASCGWLGERGRRQTGKLGFLFLTGIVATVVGEEKNQFRVSDVRFTGDSNFETSMEFNMARRKKVQTTLGELIVALTEETGRHVRDERTAYKVVAYILAGMLAQCRRKSSPTGSR